MMRAERMVDDEKIQHELDVYNALLPYKNELSATLFIEITEESEIRRLLHKFIGLTDSKALYIKINDEVIPAVFELGREEEDKISSVHYIRFGFTSEQIDQMRASESMVSLNIDYKDYQFDRELSQKEKSNLLTDFNN
jgi:hypothetical protein